MCSCDFFLAVLALIFPPFPVWVKRGVCSADSVINILLCVLGYIPGLIHAWYIIAKFPEPEYDYEVLDQDAEAGGRASGHITYVVVNENARRSKLTSTLPQPHRNMNYGATGAASTSAPAPAPTPAAAAASSSSAAAPAAAASAVAGPSTDDNGGEGRSDGPPPSYAQVVAGDNKIQSQD